MSWQKARSASTDRAFAKRFAPFVFGNYLIKKNISRGRESVTEAVEY
ncbi:hypothetical protein GLE_3261 [Lysobacter enzymogenes]|uniref:Uncharacterized protein n=1 Tax=Lysobacter enzymogenes TaxID=69 RepID=A0A0S2DJZ2_LYSEN|nr:hypothetical protein GLE_3261 [Lysobacter enzymogenes]